MKRSGFRRPSTEEIAAQIRREQDRRAANAANPSRQRRKERRAAAARRRRNDAPWREACIAERGERCRSCGRRTHVQMDHVIPRAQGGPSIVENGLPLCDELGVGCHPDKTAGRLKIRHEWLDEDQIEWLHNNGHAMWLPDGTVAGRHCRLFAPQERTPA